VAKDGVTASGYSAEYTQEIRAVSYSPVSDEIILYIAVSRSILDITVYSYYCSYKYCSSNVKI